MPSTNASTMSGSNCVPAMARSSRHAAACSRAARYGRFAVMAGTRPQTAMMRAPRGMACPATGMPTAAWKCPAVALLLGDGLAGAAQLCREVLELGEAILNGQHGRLVVDV